MGKRHLTPKEIMAQCKAVAREKRMAERTPWSAMSTMCSYVIMKKEGFKGQRILRIANKVNELEEQWSNGEIELQEFKKKLEDKADWPIECKVYSEADITAKKGSYQYWIDSKQIAPQNTINELAGRYMVFFFYSLMTEYGFGKERLTRVMDYLNSLLEVYQRSKGAIHEWKKALLEEAGVVIEMPVDPLTQTSGSMMTGA